jgi:two-component system, NarL family, response regulator
VTKDGAIRVFLVDDHPMMRKGLRASLEAEPDITVVAEAEDAESAVAGFRACRPDVTLMDLRLRGRSGVDATQEIKGAFPDARIVMLSSFDGDEDVFRAINAGAVGYVLKDASPDEVLGAIRRAHTGGAPTASIAKAVLADRPPGPTLSAREEELLRLVAQGLANKDMAAQLGISENTVRFHMKNILDKLGVDDRGHAVAIAVQRGILHLD